MNVFSYWLGYDMSRLAPSGARIIIGIQTRDNTIH